MHGSATQYAPPVCIIPSSLTVAPQCFWFHTIIDVCLHASCRLGESQDDLDSGIELSRPVENGDPDAGRIGLGPCPVHSLMPIVVLDRFKD